MDFDPNFVVLTKEKYDALVEAATCDKPAQVEIFWGQQSGKGTELGGKKAQWLTMRVRCAHTLPENITRGDLSPFPSCVELLDSNGKKIGKYYDASTAMKIFLEAQKNAQETLSMWRPMMP